jgi:hypothetical protein
VNKLGFVPHLPSGQLETLRYSHCLHVTRLHCSALENLRRPPPMPLNQKSQEHIHIRERVRRETGILWRITRSVSRRNIQVSPSNTLLSPQVRVPTCTWYFLQPVAVWAEAPSRKPTSLSPSQLFAPPGNPEALPVPHEFGQFLPTSATSIPLQLRRHGARHSPTFIHPMRHPCVAR